MSSDEWLSEFEDTALGAQPESDAEATFEKNEYFTENFHHSFGVDLPISKRRQYVELVEGIIENNLPEGFGYFHDIKHYGVRGPHNLLPPQENQVATLGLTKFRNRYLSLDDAEREFMKAQTKKNVFSAILAIGAPFWFILPIIGGGDIEAGFACNLCFIPMMLFVIWSTFTKDHEEVLEAAIEDGAFVEGSGQILDKQTNSFLVYNYHRKEVNYNSVVQLDSPAEYILSTHYYSGGNDGSDSWGFNLNGVSKSKDMTRISRFGKNHKSIFEEYAKINKICPGVIRLSETSLPEKWAQKQLESRMDEVNQMISVENEKTNQLLNKGK